MHHGMVPLLHRRHHASTSRPPTAAAPPQAAREAYRAELRAERASAPDEQLCATPFGVDVVGITEFVALTGALVGGAPRRRGGAAAAQRAPGRRPPAAVAVPAACARYQMLCASLSAAVCACSSERPAGCCPNALAGVSARRRKQELERLNEQLRTINTQLRRGALQGWWRRAALPPALLPAQSLHVRRRWRQQHAAAPCV